MRWPRGHAVLHHGGPQGQYQDQQASQRENRLEDMVRLDEIELGCDPDQRAKTTDQAQHPASSESGIHVQGSEGIPTLLGEEREKSDDRKYAEASEKEQTRDKEILKGCTFEYGER
jgi:hypothetical protein